mmetsp:Transcript_23994/g.61245  ORF Transcript_23994/g.61245 Transcript_23994/m.61245 type:complete len:162 (-) Transcript_23994:117-602(-)
MMRLVAWMVLLCSFASASYDADFGWNSRETLTEMSSTEEASAQPQVRKVRRSRWRGETSPLPTDDRALPHRVGVSFASRLMMGFDPSLWCSRAPSRMLDASLTCTVFYWASENGVAGLCLMYAGAACCCVVFALRRFSRDPPWHSHKDVVGHSYAQILRTL